MGCSSATPQISAPRQGIQNPIIDLIRKTKFVSEQKGLKKLKQMQEQELNLIQNFGLQQRQRSLSTQKAILNRTVFTKNLALIYKIVEMECMRVIDYKDTMQLNLDTVTKSLQVIVYAASILKDQVLIDLQAKVRASYPEFRYPLDQDIKYQLLRYHKNTEQATFVMENQYILEFSAKYNIDVARIDEAGHKYRYGAVQQ